MKRLIFLLMFLPVVAMGQTTTNVWFAPPAAGGGESEEYPDNLVAYWSFEETSGTIYDQVGENHSSSVGPGITYGATGVIGNCLSFPGTDPNYIAFVDTDSLDFTNVNATIGGWFYRDSYGAYRGMFGGQNGCLGLFQETNGRVYAACVGVGGYGGTQYAGYGAWHFYAVVFNNSTNRVSIYYDGSFVDTDVAYATAYPSDDATIYLGCDTQSSWEWLGDIDEVFIFKDRMLSDAELDYIYNSGSGRGLNDWDVNLGQ